MPDELSLSLRARVALEAHGFHFTHSLGQNFLLSDHAVAEIVARAGAKAGDHILEIGPGAGLLTAMMADAGADVLAVELDRAVEPVLRDVLGERSVRIVFADCMKADLKALTAELEAAEQALSGKMERWVYLTELNDRIREAGS